jgi:hypothetical protein
VTDNVFNVYSFLCLYFFRDLSFNTYHAKFAGTSFMLLPVFLCSSIPCSHYHISKFLWLYSPWRALAASHIGGFLIYVFRHMVGLLGRVITSSQGFYLHRTTQHRKTQKKTSMSWAGFEPTTAATNRPTPTPQTARPLWPAYFNLNYVVILCILVSFANFCLPKFLSDPNNLIYHFQILQSYSHVLSVVW